MNMTLKKYDVSAAVFDDILAKYPKYIKLVDDIKKYYGGYNNKSTIMYDGKEYLICLEMIVNKMDKCSIWKQCIVRRCENISQGIENGLTGMYAWNYFNKHILQKEYTPDEINERLSLFEADYNYKLKQLHYTYPNIDGKVIKHENTYKYDINGAHADALREIFPKCAYLIEDMHKKRKTNANYKKILNYYVGFLKRMGHQNTYNWIVQRTTNKLINAIQETDGILLYANTDGFIVKNPKKLLETNLILGNFKLETSGVTYTYQDKNYSCIQTYKNGIIDITGNVLYQVRDLIDLSKNQVVHYDRVKKVVGKTEDGQEITTYIATNIEKEIIN